MFFWVFFRGKERTVQLGHCPGVSTTNSSKKDYRFKNVGGSPYL